MSGITRSILAAFIFAIAVIPSTVTAQTFVIDTLVDTTDTVPGSAPPENFSSIIGSISPHTEGDFGFPAIGTTFLGTYYTWGGMPQVFYDNMTPVPGGSGGTFLFSGNLPVASPDGAVLFAPGVGTMGENGLYSLSNAILAPAVDNTTPVPDGSGDNFTGPFNDFLAVGGQDLIFLSTGSGGQQGVYAKTNGVFSVIADTSTPIPGQVGEVFAAYQTGGSLVPLGGLDFLFIAFEGFSPGDTRGIYGYIGGSLTAVVDTDDLVPGGSGNFTAFGVPIQLENGDLVFIGFDSSNDNGIYRISNGIITKVADKNTIRPGLNETFGGFRSLLALEGGNFAFVGDDGPLPDPFRGIYRVIDGVITKVVDENDMIPDGAETFSNLNQSGVHIGGNRLLFRGLGSLIGGYYLYKNGTVSKVVDTNTVIPGTAKTFTIFIDPPMLLENGNLFFHAFDSDGGSGVYGGPFTLFSPAQISNYIVNLVIQAYGENIDLALSTLLAPFNELKGNMANKESPCGALNEMQAQVLIAASSDDILSEPGGPKLIEILGLALDTFMCPEQM